MFSLGLLNVNAYTLNVYEITIATIETYNCISLNVGNVAHQLKTYDNYNIIAN